LRRRPKQLDTQPTVFLPTAGRDGGVVFSAQRPGRGGHPPAPRAGKSVPAFTGEPAELLAAPAGASPDPEAVRRAQQIAARLAIRRPRRDTTGRRGTGELASVRYRDGSDDIDLDATLDTLLRIPARGLTNIAFPLRLAREQLATIPVRDARVLLLSDCVHNAGPDPRAAAARLSRLDVLLDTSGEHDLELARDLARIGRGRLAAAAGHRAVPPALSSLFM
jgi:hypothetical protein